MRELTLNVIYTRGTVASLSFLVWSLLEHSDYCFRLVANGCTSAEMTALNRLAARSSRLSFFALPTKGIMPHGQALNYLQATTKEERFGFVDSDIFTVEPLPGRETLTGAKACFCYPATLFRSNDEPLPTSLGSACCTYLAVYDNAAVTNVIRATGIGFDKYRWSEIAWEHQQHLIQLGVRKAYYDTGQLLTLLLLEPGEKPRVLSAWQLTHIGGFSRTHHLDLGDLGPANRMRRRLSGAQVKELASRIYLIVLRLARHERTAAVWASRASNNGRKRAVSRYVTDVVDALLDGAALPRLPSTANPHVDRKLEQATRVISALFEKYGADHLAA